VFPRAVAGQGGDGDAGLGVRVGVTVVLAEEGENPHSWRRGGVRWLAQGGLHYRCLGLRHALGAGRLALRVADVVEGDRVERVAMAVLPGVDGGRLRSLLLPELPGTSVVRNVDIV